VSSVVVVAGCAGCNTQILGGCCGPTLPRSSRLRHPRFGFTFTAVVFDAYIKHTTRQIGFVLAA